MFIENSKDDFHGDKALTSSRKDILVAPVSLYIMLSKHSRYLFFHPNFAMY
jgi:hypothetical protein